MFCRVQQFGGRKKCLMLWKGYGKRSSMLTFSIKHTQEQQRGQHPAPMEMHVQTQTRLHGNEDG